MMFLVIGVHHRHLRLARPAPGRPQVYHHDLALQILEPHLALVERREGKAGRELADLRRAGRRQQQRSEEHTSELQSLMRISYAVFCLKKKKIKTKIHEQK